MSRFDALRDLRLASAPVIRALGRCAMHAGAAATAALLAGPGYGADDLPPAMPSTQTQSPPPPPAEEQQPTALGAPVPYWTAPLDDPSAPKPKRDVQIEQKHVGRRVSEVIVTPAGFTYHYSITHLDDQDPGTTPLQPHPELSVPRLFRFDF
jgi:hypothetical protein